MSYRAGADYRTFRRPPAFSHSQIPLASAFRWSLLNGYFHCGRTSVHIGTFIGLLFNPSKSKLERVHYDL